MVNALTGAVIRVVLANGLELSRATLAVLLTHRLHLDVVAAVADGAAVITAARELRPDVVVLDVTLPVVNGIEATRQIVAENPQARVIVLTMNADRQCVTESMLAGAVGYLLKNCTLEELSLALKTATKGSVFLSSAIRAEIANGASGPVEPLSTSVVLTCRERQVLQLIADGRTNREIAARLSVSSRTVESHRSQLMDKLRIYSVAGLTKYAVREGLTSAHE